MDNDSGNVCYILCVCIMITYDKVHDFLKIHNTDDSSLL